MSFALLRCAAAVALASCVASSEAAAWERPKAQPAAKVEACPDMGEGFVKIPGTGTCVSMAGSVRVEAMHVGGAGSYNSDGR